MAKDLNSAEHLGKLMQPRILILGSEQALRTLNGYDDQQAPALRNCRPVFMCYGDSKAAGQTLFQHFDTLEEIVCYVANPDNHIDGVLMGHKRKDDGSTYAVELCKALKEVGYAGQMTIQVENASEADFQKLDKEAKAHGALGAFRLNKTHKNSPFSGLAVLNKAAFNAGEEMVCAVPNAG